ncbi:MAG: IclR family transcriptional regulator [Acidimicrobiia bacterium]
MAKALDLLDYIVDGSRSLGELASLSGLPKSTTHRLAGVLLLHGFLRNEGNRYFLGYRLMELGEVAKRQIHLPSLARKHMLETSAVTHETLHLGELVGTDIIYLEKVEGGRGLLMRSRVGLTAPARTTAMGKAIVAHLPEENWPQYFVEAEARTPNTIATIDGFLAELRATRERGYAFDREENEVGICCVAAPIRDAEGRVMAAVSVSGAVVYLPPERLETLARAVVQCANAVSRELGGPALEDA